ncbi:hypothetical protein D9757_009292 [Collybiopsis confluens]|uniref:DNA replication factor Dna2 N-terminal domain-containing protein n=1 Tax=Collybiopsis confluens TaxID=2823264 RepID=A0A8H5CND6_9AGAR|nr:hypothetical protein D9757_014493 [Collybiopsis confluens]KAF5374030.1 hypothetical protein D9757_010081 [Collybiopsis confluens]KAF5379565.1 hypothetical protein D9757_009292 [Collybiopsis confluens]
MTSFLNNLLRPGDTSRPSTSYASYGRKRAGDLEEASEHPPASRSYDKPDKMRAVAGPSREEFDKQLEANRAAFEANQKLMQEIERLTRLGQDTEDALHRRNNQVAEQEAHLQAQERAHAEQALAQEQAQAEQARLVRENALTEARVSTPLSGPSMHQCLVYSGKCGGGNAESAARCPQQKAWFEQQLEEMQRQRDLIQKEKEERDSELFNLRNRQRSSGQRSSSSSSEGGASFNSSQGGTSSGPSHRNTSQRAPDEDANNSSALPQNATQNPPTQNPPDIAALVRDSVASAVAAAVAAAFAAQALPHATGQSSSTTPRSRQRGNQVPKPGSLAHRREIKKTALNQLSTEEEKQWRDYLRSCFRQITGQNNITDFRSYCPIEDAVADAFENGEGPGPTELSQYRLHFGHGYHKSRWNKMVMANMLQYTVDHKDQYRIQGMIDDEALRSFFWDFIRGAQTSWARYGRRIGQDNNLETSQEAKERADQFSEAHKESCRINGRKHSKFARRTLGLRLLRVDSSSTSQFKRTKLDQTSQVLRTLGHDGMSSEESDNEGGLSITIPHYRRRIISQMMSDLDKDSRELIDMHDRASFTHKRDLPPFTRPPVHWRYLFQSLPKHYHNNASSNSLSTEEAAFLSGLLTELDDAVWYAPSTPHPSPPKLRNSDMQTAQTFTTPVKTKSRNISRSPKPALPSPSKVFSANDADIETMLKGIGQDWEWDMNEISPKKIKVVKTLELAGSRHITEICTRGTVEFVTSSDTDGRISKNLVVVLESGERRSVILHDDWVSTDVQAQDIINVIGTFESHSQSSSSLTSSIVISSKQNLLIHHPDLLITTTAVSTAASCRRRPILPVSSVPPTMYPLHCCQRTTPKSNATLNNSRAGRNETALLAISELLDVEEDICFRPGKLSFSKANVTRGPKPLEIKTGRATAGMEHRAQTMLYNLLAQERYGIDVASGLLYYTQSEEVVQVPAAEMNYETHSGQK